MVDMKVNIRSFCLFICFSSTSIRCSKFISCASFVSAGCLCSSAATILLSGEGGSNALVVTVVVVAVVLVFVVVVVVVIGREIVRKISLIFWPNFV